MLVSIENRLSPLVLSKITGKGEAIFSGQNRQLWRHAELSKLEVAQLGLEYRRLFLWIEVANHSLKGDFHARWQGI